MNEDKKNELNALSKLFYQMKGCQVMDGHDFYSSTNPAEKGCWNHAIVACVFLKNETELLIHQLD